MKGLPAAIVLGLALLSGCGGGGGGNGSTSTTGSTGNPPPPTAGSTQAISLPAVPLTGNTVPVQLDAGGAATNASTAPQSSQFRAAKLAATALSNQVLIINGASWSPVCASQGGVQTQGDTVALVDTGCISDLTVVEVSGALIDGTPAIGKLHTFATRSQLLSGKVAVTPLTDIAFASVHLALAAGQPANEILNTLDTIAKRLIKTDINGDRTIDYNDVLSWRSSMGETPLRVDLAPMYTAYLNQSDAGLQADLAARSVNLGAFTDSAGDVLRIRNLSSSGQQVYANFIDGSIGAITNTGTLAWKVSLGAASFLAVNTQFVATASTTALYVAPTSNTAPTFLSIALTSAPIDIAIDADVVYVESMNGLTAYRISNNDLQLIASSSAAMGVHIAASQNQIAVLDNSAHLSIFQLASDNSIQTEGSVTLTDPGLYATQMVVQNNVVYIAGGLAGLLRVDISNPATPIEAAAYTEGAGPASASIIYSVAVSNNQLITLGSSGIRAITPSASAPLVAASRLYVPDLDASVGAGVVGDTVFFETTDSKLNVSAITDVVENVWERDHIDIVGAKSVAISGASAYVGTAAQNGDSAVVNVNFGGTSMSISRQYPVTGFVFGIVLHGNTAALANTTFDYQALDLQTGTLSGPNTSLSGPLVGLTSYGTFDLAFDRSGYVVYDASTPSAPTMLAQYDRGNDSDSQMGVIADDLLFEARGQYGLDIIKLSAAGAPLSYTNLYTSDAFGWQGTLDAWHIKKQGNYLYVAACSLGLFIVDVSDTAHPKVLSQTNYGQCTNHVELKDNVAYLMDSDSSVTIVDVTDNTNPYFVGTFPTRAAATNGWIDGSNLYEMDYSGVSRFPTVRALPLGKVQ